MVRFDSAVGAVDVDVLTKISMAPIEILILFQHCTNL
jgi:hypothetical protein